MKSKSTTPGNRILLLGLMFFEISTFIERVKMITEKFDPIYADIHANARLQLRIDRMARTWGMWKETEGPGMKGSKTRDEWEKAYKDEADILDTERG